MLYQYLEDEAKDDFQLMYDDHSRGISQLKRLGKILWSRFGYFLKAQSLVPTLIPAMFPTAAANAVANKRPQARRSI